MAVNDLELQHIHLVSALTLNRVWVGGDFSGLTQGNIFPNAQS